MIYFNVDESPYHKGEYSIQIKDFTIKMFPKMTGSISVLYARIMGLSYASFLRYWRDRYEAHLWNKDSKSHYFGITFPSKKTAIAAASELDSRLVQIATICNLKP